LVRAGLPTRDNQCDHEYRFADRTNIVQPVAELFGFRTRRVVRL
jgi:hypothetical protein